MGFLTIGRFDDADPRPGHEETLRMIERAEALGFDSVWVRQRHLQPGIASPVALLAAASQRTRRIELGTAVIPLGLENPLRLAEDLATVDVLSGGRLNVGVSVGTPVLYERFKTALYPETHEVEDFSKARVARLLACLRGDPVSDFEGTVGHDEFFRRVQPHSPGLADRVWYGGGLQSAVWAGIQGLNYLTANLVSSEGSHAHDFATIQAEHIDAFRAHHPSPETARIAQALVVIPTDSASRSQVKRYRAYAQSRIDRTRQPDGPRGMIASPDYVGTSGELADILYAHRGFQRVSEVAFALPHGFDEHDQVQIVTDMAEKLGPKLGWSPAPTHHEPPPLCAHSEHRGRASVERRTVHAK
ncbi:luciferase-like monooxygenase family protein [Mycobacterium intracellulare 1956]|uniref:Luciferase-like monooxygenase family protein n=2 Tax=Mycobacteriaceae TaxID=1762 RepID=X8CLI3_MYCIT|nr:luciferase-like monooxygenase family protein [Mycobacterium intracellulare]EUA56283.1 luciferase-like monooxygenase family protein [Mycobacterium intracellulare 1956]